VATYYCTKWVEAKVLWNNKASSIACFLYEMIITWYKCPVELVNDQGQHFLDKAVVDLVNNHMIIHKKLMVYFPQSNAQVESKNKVLQSI